MAILYITESNGLGESGTGGSVPVFNEDRTRSQAVTFTTATQSAAFSHGTIIRFYASAACHIKFGENPTATATSPRYAATTEYFRVVRSNDKLSVYDGSS